MVNTVPRALTEGLRSFCRRISSERPRFIPSRPATDALPSPCFDNVARKADRAGGSIVHGWAIWTLPGIYHEAEHHAVWRDRREELVDVSPQIGETRRILFLPDPDASFDPASPRPNVIEPATDDRAAVDLVAMAEERNRIQLPYRGRGRLFVQFSPSDQLRLIAIDRQMQELWVLLSLRAG